MDHTGVTQIPRYEGEDKRVLDWREEQFLALGLPPASALLAAMAELDWHALDSLLRRGCPLHFAVEILT